MMTYKRIAVGSVTIVSKLAEEDAGFDMKKYVTETLVRSLENHVLEKGGGLIYESIEIERSENFLPDEYEHVLSRDEQPLWRFLLGLVPGIPRKTEMRLSPPTVMYRAHASAFVPEEEK